MGTISDKLMRVINTKEDIRKALISKGYDVPASIPFKEYAKMILDLPCKIDDFPELPGDVTRWHFGGLTNEMMAAMDDPRIEDVDHKGRFLSFKNFAWSGMSGVNGYKFDFLLNEWVIDNNQVSEKYSYKIVINNKKNSVQLYNRINLGHIKITLKITGIEINKSTFRVYDNAGTEHKQDYTKDGIYEIDYTANEGANIIYFYVFGGNMGQLENPITIEQLPLYPGFILGDGVDDFAVTEKELNFEDTYTVYTAFIPFQNNPTKNMMMAGKDIKDFYMNYSSLNALSYYSGNKSVVINLSNGFNLLCCKRDADNMTIKNLITGDSVTATANEFINNPGLYYLWRVANGYSYARLAIAGQTICNGYLSTDEDDEKVLDWYKKQYPWLFFDQAWTVVGKTNEDEDRATIANITGNGNDLVLSNFAFSGNSGYGSYVCNFNDTSNWIYYSYNGTIEITSSTIHVTEAKTARPFLEKNTSSGGYNKVKIKVTGIKDGEILKFMSDEDRDNTINIEKDGIYSLPGSDKLYYGFRLSNSTNTYPFNCDITIEQIPEYEGYLVTDGVDDVASSKNFVFVPDFTFIGEWKFIQKDNTVAGINSSSHLYIQNRYNRGATVMINSTSESKKNITDYMTLKAITSKGKGYDENWNEVNLLYGDGFKDPSAGLNIGGQGRTEFCHMIFKNMALYMNKVFSKDDCIKAYNYLQTLKSK